MRDFSRAAWLAARKLFNNPGARPVGRGTQPALETLEDRLVPTVLDLTTVGSTGSLGGAIFAEASTQPAGSGVLNSFVRLQQKHATSGLAQGYNTDARPVQFDEKISPVFTRSLLLSDVPEVNVGGTMYREFLLDVNQTNSTPLVSLDELRFYVASSPNLTGYNPTTLQLAGNTAGFDLGAGNWIKLNSGLNPGSGIANMIALIPDSDFAGATGSSYVYLYSKFGVNLAAHGGYEEWAVQGSAPVQLQNGFISGTVFNDASGTGVYNTSDQTLAGWTVTITDVGTGLSVTTTTDANGDFLFQNLATGLGQFTTYTITVVPQSGWTNTTATSLTFALQQSGQTATNVDFGEMLVPGSNPNGGTTFVPPTVSS